MMICEISITYLVLTQFIMIAQSQQIPEQTTVNIRAVISRLNDMFGLGMNISNIVDNWNAKYKAAASNRPVTNDQFNNPFQSPGANNQYGQMPQNNGFGPPNAVPNNMANQFGQSLQNNGFGYQNGGPMNSVNQFAPNAQNGGSMGNSAYLQGLGGSPQNGGFVSQNGIPNNLPNQLAPSPQNLGFVSQNAIPNNQPNQFAPNPQNNGFVSHNGIPNNLPNQFAPNPQNNGFVSQNGITNNMLNQLSPMPQNGGSFLNNGVNGMLAGLGGVPQNVQPNPSINNALLKGFGPNPTNNDANFQNAMPPLSGFGQQGPQIRPNSYGSIPNDLLSKNFGPLSQGGSPQNGLFNGLPMTGMKNGWNPMSPNNGFGNNNLNANPQSSLFNMFQQSVQNQVSNNQNLNNMNPQNNDILFKKSFDPNYNGVSNFDELAGVKNQVEENNVRVNPYQQDLAQPQNEQQTFQQIQNQQQQQKAPQYQNGEQQLNPQQQQQQNEAVDDYIKKMLGQDIFDFAKRELDFKNEKIKKDHYPATEESLFKRATEEGYDGVTNNRRFEPSTDNIKYFHILKHPNDSIEKVRKKILLQNEWVKADKNKLNAYFDGVKKDEEERKRDEMYGRVKRGLIIDETINTNEKTTRRTHIYEDIEVGLRDWVNFGRQENSEEKNKTVEANTKRTSRCKRQAVFDAHKLTNMEADDALVNFAHEKTNEENNLMTNFMNHCDKENDLFESPLQQRLSSVHGKKRRCKRGINQDSNEAIANFAHEKTDEENHLMTNFMNHCDKENDPFESPIQQRLASLVGKERRYKRGINQDSNEAIANFAHEKTDEKNHLMTNFMNHCDKENDPFKSPIQQRLASLVGKERRYKRGTNQDSNEAIVNFPHEKTDQGNLLITNFMNHCDKENDPFKSPIQHRFEPLHGKQRRYKRELAEQIKKLDHLNAHSGVFKPLSRQKRQSKDNDDMGLVTRELVKKAEKYSRMKYNEIFPEILSDFEKYRESTYVKSLRKAYRSNGWAAKQFLVPEKPEEVLPQVFRHFKYVSKTNLEEYYFIMMMRLPKLIKLHLRTMNIVDRGFKQPTNGQIQAYTNREYEIEKDFAEFSKILRSKIFNAYLDFEDRYNEESPKFFNFKTMPPFNKDPTAPPEMDKFKEAAAAGALK